MTKGILQGRRIVLAVDGGPDTFVAADVLRRLIRADAKVSVAVTGSTDRWLPALTLSTLSSSQIYRTIEDGHALAADADLVLVMATGVELISSLASGRVMDAAGAAFLAFDGPRAIIPSKSILDIPWARALVDAMADNALILEISDNQECVAEVVAKAIYPLDLRGIRVMVTAGPTREAMDPVRFISNPSTGRMGIALADAAHRRGAEVVLLLGPTHLMPPSRVRTLRFESADQLWGLACETVDSVDVVIAAAAVGDYAPVSPSKEKIKKTDEELEIVLKRTPDVLGRIGERFRGLQKRPVLIGFAAETNDLLQNARKKLIGKHLDLVVANDVTIAGAGFASSKNRVMLVQKDDVVEVPLDRKEVVSHAILDKVVSLLSKYDTTF